MKILLLTDRMETGGAETHVAQLASGLAKMGNDVTVLSCGGRMADQLEAEGIRQIHLPIVTHHPLRLLRLRRQIIRLQKQEHYEILHAHARIPALLMRGIGKRLGGSKLVTVHAKFKLHPLLRRLYHWGDKTIAVSEDLRTYVCTAYGVPAEQVTVIPNGIDCARFFPRPEKHSSHNGTSLLFASRLDSDCSMGAELLCRLAPTLLQRTPSLHIHIAGGGNDFDRIAQLASESNRIIGSSAITMHGAVTDMPALLQEQDIFIGVSRAAMEAVACGCAVILCGNEGYLGLLDTDNIQTATLSNFSCRACPPAEPCRLRQDLCFLLEHPEHRNAMAINVRAALIHQLDATGMCRQTLMLYHRAYSPAAHRRLTIGGYFGCGNFGDDAILLGFLEGLHEQAPRVQVTALTAVPRRDRHRFGIFCVQRRNPFAVLCALLHTDIFLCGGGSLLQNATSRRSLLYYLRLLTLSKLLGSCSCLYAAGIGPLYGKRARKSVQKTLMQCDYISLRDPDSAHCLEELKLSRALLHIGADAALLMPLPPPSRTAMLLAQNGLVDSQRYVCVALKRGARTSDLCRTTIAAVRMFCNRHQLIPLLLILDSEKDGIAWLSERALPGRRIPKLCEPADAIALLAQAELTVTMRLHALIFASLAGTPAIGVQPDAMDQKIPSFARLSGQSAMLREEVSVAALLEQMESAMQEKESTKPILCSAVADLRKKAKKDLANIVAMIYNIDKNDSQKKG